MILTEEHYFVDYTNHLNLNSCMNSVDKQVNYTKQMKQIDERQIFLNVSKTELVLFSSPKNQLNYDLKIRLNGKGLHSSFK